MTFVCGSQNTLTECQSLSTALSAEYQVAGEVSDKRFSYHACAAQAEPGRLEFDLDAAPALETLLLRAPCSGRGEQLRKLLPSMEARDLVAARELHRASILVAS